MLNAALVGAFVGGRIGERAGSFIAGAGVGALLAAAVTWPLMKYAVAGMGGIFGAKLLERASGAPLGLEPSLAWAGK